MNCMIDDLFLNLIDMIVLMDRRINREIVIMMLIVIEFLKKVIFIILKL